jgi:hypothetical protein
VLISDKIDLKVKAITRYKEGNFMILKGLIQEEDITLVNLHAPNTGTPKYKNKTKQNKTKTSGRYQGRYQEQYNYGRGL